MHLSPDDLIFWQWGFLKLNATILVTWGLMLVLVIGSKAVTRKLCTGLERSRWQNLLEITVNIPGLHWYPVFICCVSQSLHNHSRV